MITKTLKIELSFQKLLSIVDQLDPDEKLLLKKKLEREKIETWQERFGRALQELGRQNRRFSEKKVEKDVRRAVARVRSIANH